MCNLRNFRLFIKILPLVSWTVSLPGYMRDNQGDEDAAADCSYLSGAPIRQGSPGGSAQRLLARPGTR